MKAERPRKAEMGTGQSNPQRGDLTVSAHRAWRCCRLGLCGEMTPRRGAARLLSALILLQVPGCWSLSGPRHVTGTVGGSLSVKCRYKKEYTDHSKYWCKSPCLTSLGTKIVETTESEREVRHGRVSIRDHPANLTFTVTLESLTEDDAGTYRCGIHTTWREKLTDLTLEVVVSVSPAPSLKIVTSTLGPPRTLGPPSSLPTTTGPRATSQEPPDPSQHPRSLLSSVHFLLLVFLKVPLLLSMLSAVLWVNRPQRSSGGRQSQSGSQNQ